MNGKTIKDYPKYIIEEDGTIWSKTRKKPKKLKPQAATQNKKYFQVRLYNKEYPKGKLNYIHRLVYENFVGEIKDGDTIDHIDNNQFNNHYTNLQTLTAGENSSKYNSQKMKLVDKKDEIRELYKNSNLSQTEIAKMYNCSSTHIWRIINRKRQTRKNNKWIYEEMED